MATTVARLLAAGEPRWAVRTGAGFRLLEGRYATTGELLDDGRDDLRRAAGGGQTLAEREARLLSPITVNQQLVCQATNYGSHLREIGRDPEEHRFNVFFRKASSNITGPYDDIIKPIRVNLLDYEVELGLVIGAAVEAPVKLDERGLGTVVAGLVILNDISARDVQIPEQQFYKGKSFRSFAPLGPYLVLLDDAELAGLDTLRLQLWVNGEERQNEHARGMVFKPAETISELSEVMDLAPGDVVATGTPGGVALSVPPKWVRALAALIPPATRFRKFVARQQQTGRYLRDGDVVRARIRSDDGRIDLGEQHNRVRNG